MPLDDETRKVIHDLRGIIHDMMLANNTRQMEQDKQMALLQQELRSLTEKLDERLGKTVSREEFVPVRLVVYGMTGMVLSGAFGAIISNIFFR